MSNKSKIKEMLEKTLVESDVQEKELNLNNSVYIPYTVNRKDFLLKIEFCVDIQGDTVVDCNTLAVVSGVCPLDQKVIARKHPIDQLNLKYYYEKGKKLEVKNEIK